MIISMISIALYGIVDTIFVSNISESALTAISLAYPIQNIITGIGLGTGIAIPKRNLISQIISKTTIIGMAQ